MSPASAPVNSYLLIDNGLLDEAFRYAETEQGHRPEWLIPVYRDKALAVSPLLIDIEAAYNTGALDQATCLVNALKPALHVSLIETTLSHEELAQHLRQFIFVVTEDERQHTLRFADCAVLAPLSTILAAEQWATVTAPLDRWCVHDRTGALTALPASSARQMRPIPFQLLQQQVDELNEAMEPDHFIAKVSVMRHGDALPGNAQQQHEWASEARRVWRVNGNTDNVMLIFLTEAALVTQGEIFRRRAFQPLMATVDLASFKAGLQELVQDIEARRRRIEQMTMEPNGGQF